VNKNIIILIAPSAAGKDFILFKLKSSYDLKPFILCTTRPMRPGEVNGKDYYFLSEDEFRTKIEGNDFLEYRSYETLLNNLPKTWYYGTLKQELDDTETYVVPLDVNGAKSFLSYYTTDKCLVVYIDCDQQTRTARAKLRSGFDQYEWDRRLEDDMYKFDDNKVKPITDVWVNNNGDCSADELCSYILNALSNSNFGRG